MSVKDNLKKVTFEEAKNRIQDYDYALISEISEMLFDKVGAISEIYWDEVQEAYFFNEKSQMHIYLSDDVLEAIVYNETDEDVIFVDRRYELAGKFSTIGREVKERNYLEFDDDGQAFVAYSRLVSVK